MGWTAALGLLRLARGSNLHEICAVLLIVRKITTPLSEHLDTASHDGGSLQFLVEMLTNKIIVATDDDIISVPH